MIPDPVRVPPLCPVCCDIDTPGLLYRRDARDGLLHVNCRCCGYDRHAELPEWRSRDRHEGGYCEDCRRPEEVVMRERNAARRASLRAIEEELAGWESDPAVAAYLAAKARREVVIRSFERMWCDDSFG